MSLTALGGSSRALAWCLLLVSLWGLPHRGAGADACPPRGAEPHDESKHVFSSEAPIEHGEHCAVCHWLRTVKPDLAHSSAPALQPDLGSSLAPTARRCRSDGIVQQLPARAPPSRLT